MWPKSLCSVDTDCKLCTKGEVRFADAIDRGPCSVDRRLSRSVDGLAHFVWRLRQVRPCVLRARYEGGWHVRELRDDAGNIEVLCNDRVQGRRSREGLPPPSQQQQQVLTCVKDIPLKVGQGAASAAARAAVAAMLTRSLRDEPMLWLSRRLHRRRHEAAWLGVTWACDKDDRARRAYKSTHRPCFGLASACRILANPTRSATSPSCSPPCNPFSSLGKREGL